jgi:sulfite reductase (NADPH) flavoprotein alpha-component
LSSTADHIVESDARRNIRSDGVWTSAPFDPALAGEVQRLVARLDAPQRFWLSGYLAGLGASTVQTNEAPLASAQPLVTVLYGSQSGNGELLSQRLAEILAQRGLTHERLDMLDCRKEHLQSAQHLLVVVSTHGEGDPPDRARPLYELLHGRKAPKLQHLKYSVLALGDASYEKFCETGRRFDAQLQALGATPLHPRVECDVDFHDAAEQWMEAVVAQIASAHATTSPTSTATPRPIASVATAYTRKNPYLAPVLANQRLTARNSTKDVRHIELSIEGAGIHYEPGDALGIVPRNRSSAVDAVLAALPFSGESEVLIGAQHTSLRQALHEHYEIGPLTDSLLSRYAAATQNATLATLLSAEHAADLRRYLHGRDLLDLLTEHPPQGLDVQAFAQLLRPMAPRLYSIASSPRATPDEIHLTVRIINYDAHGRERQGVVSGELGLLTEEGSALPIYPHRNPAFRLPSPHVPIIMIGPGTGVAPFRAFMAERESVGATGRNWLFFGDRSLRSDFLYQTEWLEWRKRGLLHRLDVAFSRDGARKVYVQHRMREHGRTLFAWLEGGAHLYVCGDAQFMAPDVEHALLEVLQEHGGMTAERASEYLLDLQRERRYQKDVY